MAFYFVSTFANAQTPTKQRPYGYRGLKIITSLRLRFPDFQRRLIFLPVFCIVVPLRSLLLCLEYVQKSCPLLDNYLFPDPRIKIQKRQKILRAIIIYTSAAPI
ncbi:hypothetical protein BJAS_P0357 [Bathymodiolus japonicus methanotrophic gill symbiont]|uniref:hypothetical protein n=1 Tax=Bathymodiolus japonicus methanotrophic gill symbiont TaxID=113269 RepID=UPI001B3FBBF0|nr:hypothetical protein [Bathymodiolus japonicus methanotrophic gill symbiont]GFO71113.1 hypothetical protein BJAS_P0357 [Bathymodiolus japonicus methanotrophic gill symbiont]